MSAAERMIDRAEDRWPEPAEVPDDALGQVLLASHLLGADRAVANFGGGNTSAKGTATDHVGREVRDDVGQGLGHRPGDDGGAALHAAAPRRDGAADRARRDERRGHGRPPRAAARLDPAAPRSSIETLLHAFVPAQHVHHTHPDGDQRAGRHRATASGWCAECFGDEAAWIPYIRPGFTLAKQVGEAVRENPGLKLVVLAKHGLVVWGDTRRGGLPAHDRGDQPRGRLRQRADGRDAALRRAAPSAGRGDARERCCATVLPALRGAVSSERPKVLVVDTSPRVLEFVSSRDAGRADHGRRRLPGPPRAHQARAAVDPVRPRDRGRRRRWRADPRARRRLPRRVPRLRRAPRRRDDGARRSRRARRADPARRARRRWARRPRPRGCRATSTTARSR